MIEPEASAGHWAKALSTGLLLLALAACAIAYAAPLSSWLAQGQLIRHELEFFGLAAPLVFTAGCAALVAIGVPRLLLCSLGGMIFGFAWGLVWTQAGTVLGAYATFLFVRWRGRSYILQRFPRLKKLTKVLETRGLVAVLVARQLPVNGLTNDLFLGLSPVKHRDFLAGTFIGFLPQGVTACLIGAGLLQADASRSVEYLAVALVCSLLLGLGLKRSVAARSRSRSN